MRVRSDQTVVYCCHIWVGFTQFSLVCFDKVENCLPGLEVDYFSTLQNKRSIQRRCIAVIAVVQVPNPHISVLIEFKRSKTWFKTGLVGDELLSTIEPLSHRRNAPTSHSFLAIFHSMCSDDLYYLLPSILIFIRLIEAHNACRTRACSNPGALRPSC